MGWRRVLKSVQALAAHTLLFSFTLLLVLKLDHVVSCSWWIIFFPLWMFHAVVARGRFSLPAPSIPRNRHWAPCHAIVAIPLLIAFELLLCIYLESLYVQGFAAVNLRIVFLPLLIFEIIILIDNLRMCRALMPGEEENMSDDAIRETLPHFWVAISMVFFFPATFFTLLKLHGDAGALGWWDLFINFGYNTFCGYPPEIIKKMPKKDLAEEVWRLQAALGKQTEITKYSQQEFERLQTCYAEFVLRGRLVLYCSHVGIVSFAALAQINVRSAQFAGSLSRSAYPYMMFSC